MNGNIVLQIERSTSGSLAPDISVSFNNQVYSHGNILYTSGADEVVFNQTGRYLIEWWIAAQASLSADGVVFGLSGTNVTPSVPIIGSSPIKTGEVVGFAVVNVTEVPATLSLVNKSNTEVWLSTIAPVKAVLRIHSHHELENIDDGNATGALIGIGAAQGYTMGNYAVALGFQTTASGDHSHSEGYVTEAAGTAAHSEGGETQARATFSHAEGYQTISSGDYSHSEGTNTQALGIASHTEGNTSLAAGNFAHAEGSGTNASGNSSHAEGDATEASGMMAHAEGYQTLSSEWAAHAEGNNTRAEGNSSHAEGFFTTASGSYSHAEGEFTSTNLFQGAHIMGRYGDAEMNHSWFLANGTDENNKGLAAKILTDGNAYIDIAWNAGGADYAELFETEDGKTIEPGYFITLNENGKIRVFEGSSDNYVLGVTSAIPSILGNAGELRWKHKYKTDEWGRIEYNTITIPAKVNQTGEVLVPERVEKRPVLNPEWKSNIEYIPRKNRPEWVAVGLLGQILVRDDGTCAPGGYCVAGKAGVATSSYVGYRVLKRMNENQILILFR